MSDKRSKSRAEFLKKQAREQALIQQRILEQQEREEQQRVNAAGSAGSGGDHVSTSLNNQLETQGLISNLLKTSSKRDRDGPDDNDGDVQDQEADSVAHRQQQQRREEFNHTIIQSAVGGGLSGKPSKYKANIIIEPSDTTQEDQTQQQTAQHEGGKPQPTAHVSKREALIASRAALPVGLVRSKILKTVEDNQICIIIGETGSGKTTQIPQFLHEAGYKKVVCTQPRRIAAISVAQRVAFEMDSRCGNLVGYKVRFDNKTSERTEVEFVTDGMMLKEMATDPDISDIGAIMIDEAHERSLATDILLGLLKDLCRRRKELKVIIASATVEAQKFSDFFWQAPILTVSGRTFDVEISYAADPLPDYPAAAAQMAVEVHLSRPLPGDILIFLTGQEDIERCEQQIHELMREQDQQRVRPVVTVPIYSALPPDDQQRIYQPPPENMRKIVIATNIAETSITIDGIVYVIDSGLCKQNFFDPKRGMETLSVVPISQASAKQRSGRAGRTKAGECIRLFTEYMFHNELERNPVPEILRCSLSSVVLNMKALGVQDLMRFDFLDTPSTEGLVSAITLLHRLGAISKNGNLTKSGRRMSELPIEPPMAKALIKAHDKYGVTQEVCIAVAMLSLQSSVLLPPRDTKKGGTHSNPNDTIKTGREAFHREYYAGTSGDACGLTAVFQHWELNGCSRHWAGSRSLNHNALLRARDVRNQLVSIIGKAHGDGNPLPTKRGDSAAQDDGIVRSMLSGFFFNVAKVAPAGAYTICQTNVEAFVHPTSCLATAADVEHRLHEAAKAEKDGAQVIESIRPFKLNNVQTSGHNGRSVDGRRNRPELVFFIELRMTKRTYMAHVCCTTTEMVGEVAPEGFFKEGSLNI